jgi:hypothetical protein
LFDASDKDLGLRAYSFTSVDGMHDLGSLIDGGLSTEGWAALATAYLTGRSGSIVGYGRLTSQTGGDTAFLLIPVPEATSRMLAIFSIAMAGLLSPFRIRPK